MSADSKAPVPETTSKRAALGIGLVGVVLGILCLGLWPLAFSPANRARPAEGGPGLVFEAPSLAISEAPLLWSGERAGEVTLHLLIEPHAESRDRFGAMLSFCSSSRQPSFLVAQWKNGVNLRVRDASARGYWEIGAADALEVGRLTLVTVTSSAESGTRLLIDGVLRAQSARTARTAHVSADEPFGGRLLLGCVGDGGARWAGTARGVAIQGEALGDEEVAQLAETIRGSGFASLSESRSLRALYLFDEQALDSWGRRFPDACTPSDAGALVVPEVFRPAKPDVLAIPTRRGMKRGWFLVDLPLNIVGFMPLGLLLGLLMYRRGETGVGVVALRIGLIGFGLSLTIEAVQVYLPDRGSSLPDLLANVLGTCAGFALVLARERVGARGRTSPNHR